MMLPAAAESHSRTRPQQAASTSISHGTISRRTGGAPSTIWRSPIPVRYLHPTKVFQKSAKYLTCPSAIERSTTGLLTSLRRLNSDLDKAAQLVKAYKAGTEPKGTSEDDVWAAKKLYDSAYHPQTGEKNLFIGRMSFQVRHSNTRRHRVALCRVECFAVLPGVEWYVYQGDVLSS
jgi:hypothetical protein